MQNKVTWKKDSSNNTSVPYMYECIDINKNLWGWRRYNVSNCYVADKGKGDAHFSLGYLSFLKAIKLGYLVIKFEES
jgi:hypothetical protein